VQWSAGGCAADFCVDAAHGPGPRDTNREVELTVDGGNGLMRRVQGPGTGRARGGRNGRGGGATPRVGGREGPPSGPGAWTSQSVRVHWDVPGVRAPGARDKEREGWKGNLPRVEKLPRGEESGAGGRLCCRCVRGARPTGGGPSRSV